MLSDSFKELNKNDPLRLAGATAFFTTFALPPIIIILVQCLSLIFDAQNINAKMLQLLSENIGRQSTKQLAATQRAFNEMAQNWAITIAGFIFLLFVSTTLFKVIKSSLNQLWKIKVVRKKKLWAHIQSRLRAILVILILGVLFSIGIVAEGVQAFLGQYIQEDLPMVALYFKSFLNYIFSILMVTVWFAMVFHFLPDGRSSWKVTFVGAFVTSIFFNIGKFILRWLLTYSNITNLYGTSAAIVLLLLFVFYVSFIFYYGATFTKVYAFYKGMPIKPLHHAIHYKLTEISIKEE